MTFFASLTCPCEDGKVLEKWVKCEGNGKFSKLWNRFWKKVIILMFWIVPMLICIIVVLIIFYREDINGDSNEENLKIIKEIQEKEEPHLNDAVLVMTVFTIFFSIGKNFFNHIV